MAFAYDSTTEIVRESDLRDGYNGTGSDIASASIVAGYSGAVTLPAATTAIIYGVSRQIIKDGKHGSVAKSGLVQVLAGTGGYSAGQRLMPEANTGKAIPWTAAAGVNASILGVAQTSAAANATGLVELAGPGIIAQGA